MRDAIDLKILAKRMEASELYDFLVKHPAVWAGILSDKPLVVRMLDQLVRDARHNTRSSARRAMDVGDASGEPTGDTAEDAEKRRRGRERKERRFYHSIFRWEVYGGKALADCTSTDLRESVAKRRTLADTNAKAADFEEALANLMGENVYVRDTLDHEAIREVHSQVYGGEQEVA